MKPRIASHALAALMTCCLALVFCVNQNAAAASGQNQLTAEEQKAGWKLLFDGVSLKGWRGYGKPEAPDHGWVVENGILKCVAHGNGGDIITVDEYNNFDLEWDWSVPAKANNGIKYLVTEKRPTARGHEYQMIDDAIVANSPRQSTASFYDVLAPDPRKPLKPVGEWNHSRVLVQGNHVEHWLNGKKVLEYELGSPELKAAIAKSKFKTTPGFADKIKGPILLTEHHDEASFRNIKIRELP
jgi:Domain of Unknown Function (DUF1080)